MPFYKKVDWEEEKETLRSLGEQGVTMADLARKYGVSRQRIKQVTLKLFPDWQNKCGYAARRAYLDEKYKKKWGLKEDTDLYRVQREKFRGKKSNALRSGIPFSIEFGELVWPTHCPILGLEINYFSEGISENSASFDRINPALGYVSGNVQVISWRANRIKNDATVEELRRIAEYLDKQAENSTLDM